MSKFWLSGISLFSILGLHGQNLHAVYEYIPSAIATFREHIYYEKGEKIVVRDSIPVVRGGADEEVISGDGPSEFPLILNRGANFKNIVIQKNNDHELLETRSVNGKNFLITDHFPELIWNTNYAGTDTLGTYLCHKATAKYRGTTLIAFYTNDIPVPAGPYKFGGLPGLIVMLYNESANPNYWWLKEVSYPFQGAIPINEGYIYSLPKLTLEAFLKKEDALADEQMRILESKMPSGMKEITTESKKVRGSVEQIYEWESKASLP